jgi:hypothetical protein
MPGSEGDKGTANTSTRPPLLRALARRVVRVLLATSPHLPQSRRVPHQDGENPPPPAGPDDNTENHGTHPHAYEQLLVGWVMGAACYGGGRERGGEEDPRRTTRHPPHAYGVVRGDEEGLRDGDDGDGTKGTRPPTTTLAGWDRRC